MKKNKQSMKFLKKLFTKKRVEDSLIFLDFGFFFKEHFDKYETAYLGALKRCSKRTFFNFRL